MTYSSTFHNTLRVFDRYVYVVTQEVSIYVPFEHLKWPNKKFNSPIDSPAELKKYIRLMGCVHSQRKAIGIAGEIIYTYTYKYIFRLSFLDKSNIPLVIKHVVFSIGPR